MGGRTAGAAALGVLVAGSLAAACSPPDDGPMRVLPEHATLARGPVGTTFTDGFDVLHLEGDQPATILEVRSHHGDGLEFLGAMVAGPDRRLAAWAQLPGYPPSKRRLGELVQAEGAVVDPLRRTRREIGYELLLGYRVVDDSAVSSRSSVEIVYRVGTKEYLWRSPSRLVYCPEDQEADACFETAERDGYDS